jgi:hypothetical protein
MLNDTVSRHKYKMQLRLLTLSKQLLGPTPKLYCSRTVSVRGLLYKSAIPRMYFFSNKAHEICQVLKARSEVVDGLFLLFPCISHIGSTPNGRSLAVRFLFPEPLIITDAHLM